MKSKKIKDFQFEFSVSDRNLVKLKAKVFKFITKNSMPLFFKGNDKASQLPLVSGSYEVENKALIDFLVKNKSYKDFLLDIGANIGLISCQSGKLFKEVHLFEPNPDCVHILKVNTRINLNNHPYFIYEYGLGAKDETCKLFIPINNWGGAFIQSESNSYSDDELASKDGYRSANPENYLISEVKIKSAKNTLSKIFQDLQSRGLSKGVIKIDVEGCEKVILNAIADILPEDFKLAIIFENWSKAMRKKDLIPTEFKGKCDLFLIDQKKVASGKITQILSKIAPVFKQHKTYFLNPIQSKKLNKGDFLLLLSK